MPNLELTLERKDYDYINSHDGEPKYWMPLPAPPNDIAGPGSRFERRRNIERACISFRITVYYDISTVGDGHAAGASRYRGSEMTMSKTHTGALADRDTIRGRNYGRVRNGGGPTIEIPVSRCDCCGGKLPAEWETLREQGGECTGSIDPDTGNCRAVP